MFLWLISLSWIGLTANTLSVVKMKMPTSIY
jgi:hypothetical protein